MNWHRLELQEVFERTGSSESGLATALVEQKQQEHGPNELQEKKKKPAWMFLIGQFADFMILVLIAAAVVSGIVGDLTDTIIILIIVLLNAIVGFVQEYRAEQAMDALKKMASPQTHVLRNGRAQTISSRELVPGDIVLLEAGSVIPADLRLSESHALRIEESSLTGESVPVDKTTEAIDSEEVSLGDRINMAYNGTQVINGRGSGVVVSTGMNTEIGAIARMLQEKKTVTPLQKRMTDFGKKLSLIILIICILLFVMGILRGEPAVQMLLVAISLAVAAIPEALPALITVALARGAKRLVSKKSLIRKLPAVETLGSVTYICTDKTGTLTQNRMQVVETRREAAQFDKRDLADEMMALNHDVAKTPDNTWMGDPTEVALIEYYMSKHGEDEYESLSNEFPRVGELPFDSDRKCMTTVHKMGTEYLVITKGAAEVVADRLHDQQLADGIGNETQRMASNGMRVLAYGYRILNELPPKLNSEELETDLRFGGLVGMIDPPREEVKAAIRECKDAGIHPVMITGDHRATAAAIARELEILSEGDLVISGPELARMNDDELDAAVEKIKVYARVSPQQKLDIIRSLQRKKHFVAMTGDGVNDAPSLKAANIGVAMGITGTDVSKQAADMILLDDNFATIVNAIREGRRIYDNIRKFIKYIMTCNGAEILTIFLAPLFGLPIPLQPIHILWINLVTDGLPGLALSSEKADRNIMQRPPRKTTESVFAGGTGTHVIWVGALMAATTLATQAIYIDNPNGHWPTMVFTVLSLSQLGHVFAIRSDTEFIYQKGIFSNPPLLGAIALTFLLQLGVIYIPAANDIFKTQPLTLMELLICIGVSAVVFHAVEFEKMIKKLINRNKAKQSFGH